MTEDRTFSLPLPMRTERLYLRRYLPSDGEALSACLSDPETVRFEPYPPLEREQSLAEAAERAENPDFLAVCLPPDDAHPDGYLIGSIFFSPCAFAGYELAYLFRRAYWHRGLAWEACRAVMVSAFASGEVHRVLALCDAENAASRRLLEGLGMRCEGVMRQNLFFARHDDGTPDWRDTCMYAVLADEFPWGGAENAREPEWYAELSDDEWAYTGTDNDRLIARAVVYDDNGYFYFVRANRDDDFGRAVLIETSGGGMEPGETTEEAVRRELKEELGAEVEIVGKIGVVSDHYNLIRRHNINHYFLCRAVSFGERHMTEDEVMCFRLSTLRLTFDEAMEEYAARACTRIGRLIKNRELPVLLRAKEMMEKKIR